MSSNTVIAFDFGTKSIGVAVGQTITGTARPLAALKARDGIPDWELIAAVFRECPAAQYGRHTAAGHSSGEKIRQPPARAFRDPR